jgi:hypothetical protein
VRRAGPRGVERRRNQGEVARASLWPRGAPRRPESVKCVRSCPSLSNFFS